MTGVHDIAHQAGQAVPLAAGLRRVLAPNPSAMTGPGTNTYLLGERALAVIDPGPEDSAHLRAILAALKPGQHVSHILVTHAHRDHAPLARALAAETGAPVCAYGNARAGRSPAMQALADGGLMGGGEGVDHGFAPDVVLADGARIAGDGWTLTALWTPGHFGNHLSFAWEDAVFTGDLVMGWASSLVSPPDGDMTRFLASCARLRGRDARVLHPGHGGPVTHPAERLDWLIAHRRAREAAIMTALADGPADAATLAARLYTDTPRALLPAAARNVLAHLVDLGARGAVQPPTPLTANTRFARTKE